MANNPHAAGTLNWGMLKNPDMMMAFGVIGIICMMILPLSAFMLDICLSLSIAVSIVILMVSVYTIQPVKFSVFPSLLLVSTLYRLSLNIASTRVILLHGSEGPSAAGHVIMSFGNFVVGGNFAVGLIVFLILVIINFVVITKGAGRIAEVSARFTLDAMPGKQMSIDADLNAGLIDDVAAKRRRAEIAQEADFYGAMDGSSKFIRGDAIAGLAITFINIIGGLFIGVFQSGMGFMEALRTYTLLTIGDGLVAQIPALIVSTAAGLIMTRAASETNLGENIVEQLSVHPKAISSASGILLLFGLIPGLPHIPFILLGGSGLVFSYMRMKKEAEVRETTEDAPPPKAAPEKIENFLKLDVLALELGYGLISMADIDQGGELQDRIRAIRKQFATELGIIIPPIHVRDNLQLKPNMYRFVLKGNDIAKDEIMPGCFMALDPGTAEGRLGGIAAKDPAFGLPAEWIKPEEKDKAKYMGYTVVDSTTVVVTHLAETLRRHAHELLGRQDVQSLLDNLAESYPKVVQEIIPEQVSIGLLQKVLQNLLKERVCIRDLMTIVETMADLAPSVKDPDILTEYVRQALSRTISKQYLTKDNMLKVITLDMQLEDAISNAFKKTAQGGYAAIEPEVVQGLLDSIGKTMQRNMDGETNPVILCAARARSPLKKIVERHFPHLAVLSHNEITDNVKVQTVGEVKLAYAN